MPSAPTGHRGHATALALLVAINLFNYIDRQVLAAVEPEIRRDLLADMSEDSQRTWSGLLSTVFLVSYMLLAPVFGPLGDRFSRWKLVGFGVIFWSLASGLSGVNWVTLGLPVAAGYWMLLLTRSLVGVGEAAYGPVAPAMISDMYPVQRRGQIMAWFYLAIPVGGALGYALGGAMKGAQGESWRLPFLLVVPPGLLLGLLCFFFRDPPRATAFANGKKLNWEDILALLKIPSFLANTVGMTFMTFAIGGLAYWMPDYLESRQALGLFGIEARTCFGGITALAGLTSTMAGGWAGDWLRQRFSGSYFLVSGIAILLGAPALVAFLYTPFPFAWGFVFLAVFCLFFNTGPTNTILANVTQSTLRASGFALNILIIHLFGDAISPVVVGAISDHFSQNAGFLFMAVIMGLAGCAWLLGVPHLQRDTARVGEVENGSGPA